MIRHTKTVKNAGTDSPIEYIQGARYHPELSNVQIAREVRNLIKQAIAADLLPPMKVSVRTASGSITARIIEADFEYKSQMHVEAKDLIERFLRAYQKAEHWINADYHDCNFHAFVDWWVS